MGEDEPVLAQTADGGEPSQSRRRCVQGRESPAPVLMQGSKDSGPSENVGQG